MLKELQDDQESLEKVRDFLQFEILPEIQHDDLVIPEKYDKVVKEISQFLQMGALKITCYLNLDTLEIEDRPEGYEDDEWFANTGEEPPAPKYLKWENYLSFEPLDSRESYRIMEDFTRQIRDNKTRDILLDMLDRRKPFSHFNGFIHNSSYLDEWYAFKNKAYEKYVKELIQARLSADE